MVTRGEFLEGKYLCYRCLTGHGGKGVFICIMDGDPDNEQCLCEPCAAEAVAAGYFLTTLCITVPVRPLPDGPKRVN